MGEQDSLTALFPRGPELGRALPTLCLTRFSQAGSWTGLPRLPLAWRVTRRMPAQGHSLWSRALAGTWLRAAFLLGPSRSGTQ